MDKPNLQLIVGPSGCGKTWLLCRALVEEVGGNGEFDYVFILAPTIFINRTYIEWEHANNPRVFIIEILPSSLHTLLKYIIKLFTECIVDDSV